ncbi:MAG: hypothetical protein A3F12_06655 [Gammaproteobacteria bacterium RIFCSPHIGHO2_12_FULL_38_14]|nr:MAG: hypothetical protein A3F12_06655 [Gammaproteobacteria bacterium RIFCSPHIGHO2_12_FULL_38_14]
MSILHNLKTVGRYLIQLSVVFLLAIPPVYAVDSTVLIPTTGGGGTTPPPTKAIRQCCFTYINYNQTYVVEVQMETGGTNIGGGNISNTTWQALMCPYGMVANGVFQSHNTKSGPDYSVPERNSSTYQIMCAPIVTMCVTIPYNQTTYTFTPPNSVEQGTTYWTSPVRKLCTGNACKITVSCPLPVAPE